MTFGSHRSLRQNSYLSLLSLEFAVFCVENVAARLGVKAELVYKAFTEKSDILHGYIVPEYEILHTQGKEYIVNDLLELMQEKGVTVCFDGRE